MKKVLYIDDEADKGWGSVLQNIFEDKFNVNKFEVVKQLSEAKEFLNEEYDLILLDLRFGEKDHSHNDIKTYGGYKLLNDIRQLDSKNFATPVIIFTASNKIWTLNTLFEKGADSYFTKEHPDSADDFDFSINNYMKFLDDIEYLVEIGIKRKKLWARRNKIFALADEKINNETIKNRIDEKLRIGYGLFNRKITDFEKNKLVFNNEIISFIVFWSILEEISKYIFQREGKDINDPDWIIRNGAIIQNADGSYFPTIIEESNIWSEEITQQINLSSQISAILRYHLGWSHHQIFSYFLKKFNNYRNKIDFIHGSNEAIFNNLLSENQDSKEAYKKSVSILDFIIEIIKSI